MQTQTKELLFFTPIFKEMIWGGDKLQTEFSYEIPSATTGECWAVSAHKNGNCSVKLPIRWQGETLRSLWKNHQELFGFFNAPEFPLLIKIIDAKQDLSIQVHPDDIYAQKYENGAMGKTECWYVLDCDKDAQIVIGHHASDKKTLKNMIYNKEWEKFIRKIPIKKGDFFQITPGTVHAIQGGTLILEIQQNSDITYRVYDYDRLSNGQPRELHIQKSLDVIKVPYEEFKNPTRKMIATATYSLEELVHCEYYTVERLSITGQSEFHQIFPFMIYSVIEGTGQIDGTAIKAGDHFIIPNGYGKYQFSGNHLIMIRSYIDE